MKYCLYIFMLGYLISCAAKPKTIGITEGRFHACSPKPNCVCSQSPKNDNEHYIEAFSFTDLESSKKQLIAAINEFGDTKIISETSNYLHVEFTTGWMKYVDDVQFYFNESTQEIELKSASRIGYSDMGVNRKRIEKLRGLYEDY